jgi:hypothetical protein
MQVKQCLTGFGRADKKDIQIAVQALLQLPSIIKPDDASDALAIAICHARMDWACTTFSAHSRSIGQMGSGNKWAYFWSWIQQRRPQLI